MLSYIGLSLIIVAWVTQIISKDKLMHMRFVLIYALGVALLAIDGFLGNLTILAVLNSISFVSAVVVFLKLRK